MRRLTVFALGALAIGSMAASSAAEAQSRYRPTSEGIVGYVHAESRYGTATVSGPVRQNKYGRLEVRLPGGTWLECGRSCRETLRRETVDFWQSRNDPRNPYVDGPGYLRFRF